MALIIKGDMPSICKKCKSQGGLTDGSFNYICCDDNYLDFYCEGDNPNGRQILCEIPDKHGDLIDRGLVQQVLAQLLPLVITNELTDKEIGLVHRTVGAIAEMINEQEVVVEATE